MRSRAFALVLAIMLAPGALGAQSPESRIEAARRRAQEAGVPVALLDSRVAEGRAKGVSMDRIAAAVERRATSLLRARAALRGSPGVTSADLSAGADAVEAGIGEAPLREVVSRARAADRPVAIAVLTYLHREQGLPVAQALARVTAALAAGPEALRNLPTQARGNGIGGQGGASGENGRPEGVGGGPPAGVPGPGNRPGSGRPEGVGRPDDAGGGRPPGAGRPGGR